MRYSIEPRDRTSVKGYGFLSFAKNMGKNFKAINMIKAKKSTTDAIKAASKRAIPKTAEATDDLTGNKIADKTTSVSKKSTKKLRNEETDADKYISKDAGKASLKDVPKKRYLSPEERQQIIDELKLV